MTLLDAYNFVLNKRSTISPNNGFFEDLIKYERKLYGKNTVRMVVMKLSSGFKVRIPDVYQNSFDGVVIE